MPRAENFRQPQKAGQSSLKPSSSIHSNAKQAVILDANNRQARRALKRKKKED